MGFRRPRELGLCFSALARDGRLGRVQLRPQGCALRFGVRGGLRRSLAQGFQLALALAQALLCGVAGVPRRFQALGQIAALTIGVRTRGGELRVALREGAREALDFVLRTFARRTELRDARARLA